ncbi:SDR family oxidoreductase [Lentzea sp. NPDC004782]|uniref:SDR family oxidoreductase n=1 Tax=Lentzea sp. NPDC004782 TaxID=3154458 RepID=UPI0033B02A25
MTRGWVLVTGASRGIGAAVARRLAKSGFDLLLWARDQEALTSVAAEVGAVRVRTAAVDVGDATQVDAAAEALPQLAGVVLNAGSGRWAPLGDVTPDMWSATVRTNLDGSYHVLRAVLPRLAAQGLVVGMLSDSVRYPHAGRAAYTASKAGMAALLEVVRREVRESGVRISALLPSRVDTYFQGSYAEAGPGTREGSLSADDVAEVVGGLFDLPGHVEVRRLELAAMTSTYGPFPERVP